MCPQGLPVCVEPGIHMGKSEGFMVSYFMIDEVIHEVFISHKYLKLLMNNF